MNFEEVLPALKAGKKIRRKCWDEDWFVYYSTNGDRLFNEKGDTERLCGIALVADDWEIVVERDELEIKIDEFLDKAFAQIDTGCPVENKYTRIAQLAVDVLIHGRRRDLVEIARETNALLLEVTSGELEIDRKQVYERVRWYCEERKKETKAWYYRDILWSVGIVGLHHIEEVSPPAFQLSCNTLVSVCYMAYSKP